MNNKFFYLGKTPYSYDWYHLLSSYKKIVRPQDWILEIGSSNLQKTKQLVAYCHGLIGLEKYKKRMPKNLELRGLNISKFGSGELKVINGDWHNLTKIFKNRKFDLVVASHVIEHVEDDLVCLNKAFAVLKKGGYFLFTTPNRLRLFERLRSVFKGERKFPYHEHLREYNKEDIEDLILRSKLCKSKTSITGFVFGIHTGPFYMFLKHVPNFLKQWTNFWEVIIQKS
ncbi:MAG: class I SAM-dependent methyltransferase [Candidatus Shapirobacteria bacterium]